MPLPEERMRHLLARAPLPGSRRPQRLAPVAVVFHERLELRIGDIVPIHREGRDVHNQLAELVVPSERHRRAPCAKRRRTRGDLHAFTPGYLSMRDGRDARRPVLLIERKTMPDVLQRLLVHLLVFDDGEHRLRAVEQRMPRTIELDVRENILEPAIRLLDVRDHRVTRGPRRAQRIARHLVLGIDAPREQHLERRVNPIASERLLDQRVDAEGGQMPLVENDGIAQRDGAAVVRLGGHEIEQLPRSRTHTTEAIEKRGTIDRGAGRDSVAGHVEFLRT